jgi:hypothetical protein
VTTLRGPRPAVRAADTAGDSGQRSGRPRGTPIAEHVTLTTVSARADESLEGAGEPAVEDTRLIFDFDGEHLVFGVACSIGSQRSSSSTSPATRHHLGQAALPAQPPAHPSPCAMLRSGADRDAWLAEAGPAGRAGERGLRTPRHSSHWRRTRHTSSHGHRLAHSVVTNEYAV